MSQGFEVVLFGAVLGALPGTFFTNVEAVSLPNCNYDHYVGGTIRKPDCKKCPKCEPGFGLNQQCNNHVRFPKGSIQCIPCPNGTFSSYYKFGMCDECRPECSDGEVETQQCLPTKNRLCKCSPGIFEHGGHGQCNQECCDCSHGHGIVNKCREDNIGGKLCAPPGTSGKCPPLHTTIAGVTGSKKTSTSTITIKTAMPKKRMTATSSSKKRMTTTRPSRRITTAQPDTKRITITNNNAETIPITIKLSIWVYLLLTIIAVVLLVALLIYCVWYCKNRNTCRGREPKQSGSNEDVRMDGVLNSTYATYACDSLPRALLLPQTPIDDTMSPYSLVSEIPPPPVPTSARPPIPETGYLIAKEVQA